MMNSSIKTIIALAAILIFGLSTFAQSQPSPSLEDTYAFIGAKLDGTPVTYKGGDAIVTLKFTMNDAYKSTLWVAEDFHERYVDSMSREVSTFHCQKTVRLRLNEMALDSIKVVDNADRTFSVVIRPSGTNKIDVSPTCSISGPGFVNRKEATEVKVYGMMFRDRETAEKVAKALTHAVKLNGGKEELF